MRIKANSIMKRVVVYAVGLRRMEDIYALYAAGTDSKPPVGDGSP